MSEEKIIMVSANDFMAMNYIRDRFLQKIDSEKIVTIQKNPSPGPSINVMHDMIYPYQFLSSDEIERRVKKEELPEYIKRSLKECSL